MIRAVAAAALAILAAGCSDPVAGTAVTSSPTTNKSGLAHVTFDPCKDIPASVITELQLDRKPPRSDTQTDGDIENVFCKYYPRGEYLLTIAASNYTLDMLKQAGNQFGYQELVMGGRKMLFAYRTRPPDTSSCTLNVAATTGLYGVLIDSSPNEFAPYPDCMTAARKNMEGLLPYFPQ